MSFANGQLTRDELYQDGIAAGIGPEVRRLVRPGVDRARKLARRSLSRRNLV